jgi:inorganic phosphate transporter, PiT family
VIGETTYPVELFQQAFKAAAVNCRCRLVVTGFDHRNALGVFIYSAAEVGPLVNFAKLGGPFFLPLLVSPLIAVCLGAAAYVVARGVRIRLGVTKEWCLCVGATEQLIPISEPASVLSFSRVSLPDMKLATQENCTQRYKGRLVGINVQQILDVAHFISAGGMSFARGLNDTPKIVALLLFIEGMGIRLGMLAVACGMAVGGLLNARKVAITMSQKITRLNHGQGFTSNLVTTMLVIFASRLGLPVSTTHVSVGSLFGIGLVTRQVDFRVIVSIVLSWILTLPVAAILAWVSYWLLKVL